MSRALTYEVHSAQPVSLGNTSQLRIRRPSACRSQKGRKFLFPQCKTSIGNNSHSIKQSMKSACSIGLSITADRTA